VLGYRQCGERAVRVDILERLADLIRPALAWRDASPGAKPAGAFDGRSFVVTQAMTSLTGSAGEDFASILRALGYRMDRRPQPAAKPAAAEPVPAATEVSAETAASEPTAVVEAAAEPLADTPATEAASPADVVPAAEVAPVPAPVAEEAASARTPLPRIDFAPVRDILDVATPSAEGKVAAAAVIDTAVPPGTDEIPAAQSLTEAANASDPATEAAAAPVELVEVWRPMSAVRPVMIARDIIAATNVPQRARRLPRPAVRRQPANKVRARPARTGMGGATVTAIFANRVPISRPMVPWRPMPRRSARLASTGARTATAGRANASTARDARNATAASRAIAMTRRVRVDATRDASAVDVIATGAAKAVRRTGNMRRARRRATAIVQSIPIRRSPSWPRSRSR
jgi:hypothetical protein